ncbi:MAG: CaiB/BaiF CoA-transferase family protein [Pseudomonadota bacterium]
MTQGALDGLKVLDFSTLLPGPMASLFLAEAGADVIKIERPDRGDEMRVYEPRWGRDSVNFAMLNRGKKSIALDLKDPDERDRLKPLLQEADVVIEQFRPGVMDRLGLGYADLCTLNDDIIYCSITGYGQSGPKADRAGHDMNYIGDAGLLALSSGPATAPVLPPALIADIAGGTYPAVFNILLALLARNAGKGGAHLDISMADNLFPFMYWAMGDGQAAQKWPGNGDALVTGGSPRYRIYPTSDGKLLAAAPIEPKFWAAFTDAIGLPSSLRDDSVDPAKTIHAVAELIVAEPSEHWAEIFDQADCCCTIVQSVEHAIQDPHFQARGLFDHRLLNEAGESLVALPVPVMEDLRKDNPIAKSPKLGADTDSLLTPAASRGP